MAVWLREVDKNVKYGKDAFCQNCSGHHVCAPSFPILKSRKTAKTPLFELFVTFVTFSEVSETPTQAKGL